MKIHLPTKKGNPNTQPEIEFKQLVVIGANGSGKTRFGSRIEEENNRQTHRISAQKSLIFSDIISPTTLEKAESDFLYGYYTKDGHKDNLVMYKFGQRWGSNYNTSFLNDFEKLLTLLHTEEYQQSVMYKQSKIDKPFTKLDKVQKIWETILPHRQLLIGAGTIETYPSNQEKDKYKASEMSDGERVIFYLAGEVICAPQNSIIIIDEPEMHIHKSLIKSFFDLIENERPDCVFVYLTHDIDFAITRQNAVKIWTKSYEGNNVWDYEILTDKTELPEQLYLELLGSRKPVIFIEGDNSSIDYKLYLQIYTDFTIKPLGSCKKVIHSVKAFNSQDNFHHIKSFGIIDRDRRSDEEIAHLNTENVWVLDVAEVENLFLLEELVKNAAMHMGKVPEEVFKQVKENIIQFFTEQIETQIILHFREGLRKEFYGLTDFRSKNITDSLSEINNSFTAIDKKQYYDNIKTEFDLMVTRKDYESILKVFNLKGAIIPQSKVCELTGIKNKEEYVSLIITLLKKVDESAQILKMEIEKHILK